MKKIALCLLMLFITCQSFGAITFEKTYAGPEMSYELSVQYILPTTPDKGYAMLCSHKYNNLPAVCLIKTDSLGNQEWQKNFFYGSGTFGSQVVQTADGGYLAAGYNDGYTKYIYDTWLVKLNSQGVQEWEKFIPEGETVGRTTSFTADNEAIFFTGYFQNRVNQGFLCKTTLTGDTLWTKKFNVGTQRNEFSSFNIWNNQNYILISAYNQLFCYSKNGEKLWQKRFAEPIVNVECGDSLQVLTSGSQTGEVFAKSYSILADGDSLGFKKLTLNISPVEANKLVISSLQLDQNHNLYAGGALLFNGEKAWVGKFSAYGQPLWQYVSNKSGSSFLQTLAMTVDDGVIGGGALTIDNLNFSAYLTKLDESGQIDSDASSFFPLQTGNVWEYECNSSSGFPMIRERTYQLRYECLNDTILADNKTYKKIRVTELRKNTVQPIYYQFQRFDQASRSLIDNNNNIIPSGGTTSDTLAGGYTSYLCTDDKIEQFSGYFTRQKNYVTNTLDEGTQLGVAQNLGLVFEQFSASFSGNTANKNLVYAKIDGVEHGSPAVINNLMSSAPYNWNDPLYAGFLNADTVNVSFSCIATELNLPKGLVLKFEPQAGLEIRGGNGTNTAVNGTVDYPVSFLAADTVRGWQGIKFADNDVLKTTELHYCIIKDVRDSTGGGALKIGKGNKVVITDCTIEDNDSKNGGGIWVKDAELSVKNSIFTRNQAVNGGAIYAWNCNPYLLNNTIVANQSDSCGGGIYLKNSDMKIYNTILWQNSAPQGSQIYLADDLSDPWLMFCDIQYGLNGLGGNGAGNNYQGNYQQNISTDPLLNDSLHQLISSPCINSGTVDTSGLFLPVHDLAGNPRIYQQRVDIGAYEAMYTGIEENSNISEMALAQNCPNPFNPVTRIGFQIKNAGDTRLTVYNSKGELVQTLLKEFKSAGRYSVNFEGSKFNSGIYFYKLESDGKIIVNRMLLLK